MCREKMGGLRLGLLGLLIAAAVTCSWADDGSMSGYSTMTGGRPRLMQEHPQIAMTSEFVHAWIAGDSARVECIFFLSNRGESTTALIGFPNMGDRFNGKKTGVPFRSFASFVDGQPVWTHVVEDATPDSDGFRAWYLKTVSFGARQTRCVRDVYVGGLSSDGDDNLCFSYVLMTGSSWAGTIGVADIVFTLEDVNLDQNRFEASPAPASQHG
jgi:hypothetical protein